MLNGEAVETTRKMDVWLLLASFARFAQKLPYGPSLRTRIVIGQTWRRPRTLRGRLHTSGRIHGELFRLLSIFADKKTKRHFEALGDAVDVDSEAYCWRRSGFFWRMRASFGLACAQATTLCT